MPKEIIKNTDSHLVVKIVDESPILISFNDGEKSGIIPKGYSITGLQWSQSSMIPDPIILTRSVSRDDVYKLFNTGSFDFFGKADNTYFNEELSVSTASTPPSYTLIIELKKII